MDPSQQNHLMKALEAALEAGNAILEVYRKPWIEREMKEDSTPVTEADRAAHSLIMEILQPLGLPVLSEEGKKVAFNERRGWDNFWLVDPLDGTKEFLKKNGEFTVNIALIGKNAPVAGVLYAPLPDLMYFSGTGTGAFRLEGFRKKWKGISEFRDLQLQAQSLPLETGGQTFRVVASRSHRNRDTKKYIRTLRKIKPGLETVSRGSALKFCLVAEGSADIYPRFGPTWEWDTAAGQAIAEAAGCRVTLQDGTSPLKYNKESLLNPWFIVRRD